MDTYTVDNFLDYCYNVALYLAFDSRDPSREIINIEVVNEEDYEG